MLDFITVNRYNIYRRSGKEVDNEKKRISGKTKRKETKKD